MRNIVLASSSPRRKDLLEQIKLPFEIIPSDIEENISELSGTPAKKAEQLSYQKARDVADKVQKGLILGADTIVVIDDEILGKPKDSEDAYNMLKKLSGKEHEVITGICLLDLDNKIELIQHETTFVKFIELDDEKIKAYIKSGEAFGKAGSYAAQGVGAIFVKGIKGCYSNIVGLPLNRLGNMLEKLNEKIIK
ncbi:Maf family protein [Ruminiclostridium cellulolyticum]|uniref:dTTP/UTP pyrophosphatase n=1 Tax=Ruminiclostridium cellulolyticum (strain ATCC 35319 / DSM 5812 / JCM 6584 / H10) TaxID=394503 RepID=NTPPA_RUMCH|nr:Maf family protein [Ruminiclostridium cellulolyticum]B8I6Q1.1 RecName: Full=dTTP/UTP pyrophosphatase; Short=dTTPase/UTPase; AltName: Full=Nucleoside triphosphate pyrophosphatase; AltName: Full=Nucleotide pyrophosphatase; Short=Nucleotide PPase [Ruminiclostridium cellulolyticum H10]ACL76893.1 maf protein [Ruminiclostridium cellulolyticum H10]